jgi:hypothetical protein
MGKALFLVALLSSGLMKMLKKSREIHSKRVTHGDVKKKKMFPFLDATASVKGRRGE